MNSRTNFAPHVTVATVVEREGHFLLVEEHCHGQVVINQPAGHLEADETLIEAAVRETLEETGWHVEITAVLSLNLYHSPSNDVTYHRTTFIGKAIDEQPDAELDTGIIRALWLTPQQILARQAELRSPLVLNAVEQFLDGQCFPLALINNYR